MADTTAQSIEFTVPSFPSSEQVHVFELMVTDNQGLRRTSKAIVNIPVDTLPPYVEAGETQQVKSGDPVQLAGETSAFGWYLQMDSGGWPSGYIV